MFAELHELLQNVSLFLFYGRWGLPLPRRVPISVVADVIRPPSGAPIAAPTDAQLDEHHERVYNSLAAAYANARHAIGLPDDARLLIK